MSPENSLREQMDTSAARALSDYLKVRSDEKILIIYDSTTEKIALSLEHAAGNSNISATMRKIEITGGNGRNPDDETCDMMKRYPVVIAPTKYSLTHCAAAVEARKSGARVATLPGISDGLFCRGLKLDPSLLHDAGELWLNVLRGSHDIRITSAAGADFNFSIGMYAPENDDGCILNPGESGNLPAGEVFVAPDKGSGDGRIVVDGSIASFDWDPGSEPVVIDIEKGRALSFRNGLGPELEAALGKAGDNAFLLAEFGIGTHPDFSISGNLLEDEKVRGTIHIAFGNNTGFGGDNNVPVHIDCLVRNPDVYVDGKKLMDAGEWKLK